MKVSIFRKGFFKFLTIFMALAAPLAGATETVLIGADASWYYYNQQTPPPEDWKSPGFNGDQWNSGRAQLGYGDGDEATVIDGGALNPHPVSAYFLRSFIIDVPPSSFSKLVFRLLRDDGAVVYLNGVEVLRSNMPDGLITPDTLAATTVGADGETTFYSYDVPSSALVSGENVVAVEVHQANVSSSDVSFALQVIGVSGDVTPPPQPVVSITATQTQTAESDTGAEVSPGVFVIKRTGSTDSLLPVYVDYGGTAGFGTDYSDVLVEVDLAVGQASREVVISPLVDFTKEPTETVIATISQPPTTPNSIPYDIDPDHGSATVYIADSPTAIEITSPSNGASFAVSDVIDITAVASATEGTFQKIQFYDGDTLIGAAAPDAPPAPGTHATYHIQWHTTLVGDHVLTARGTLTTISPTVPGGTYYSQKVIVHVTTSNPWPLVSIVATQAETTEADPAPTGAANPIPGKFTVSRTGSLDAALPVYIQYAGSATPAVDYTVLPTKVIIPAGEASTDLLVQASADTLTEGPETVIAKILEPPTSPDSVPYTISAEHASATVTILDKPVSTDPPVLSIEAMRPTTSEPLPNAIVASGLFTIHRSGRTDTSFSAFVTFRGTATEGVDYKELPISISFAAGQTDARIEIVPLSDDLVEGPETVIAELSQPPTAGPVAWYNIDPNHDRAEVTIEDEDSSPARITITSPADGAGLPYNGTVTVKATAVDPDGYIPRVEFFSDDVSIGVSEINFLVAPPNGTPIDHQVDWHNLPFGQHVLTARGVRANGEEIVSPPVHVFVAVIDPPPPPVVSIRTVADPTERPIPNADYASDFFEIRRTGPTNNPLNIYFDVPLSGDHIATPDVDYKALTSPITIPAGQFATYMRVEAIDDTLVEGPEIVRVTLAAPPADGAIAARYMIDSEHSSADVTILDNDQNTDQVTIGVEVPDSIASEHSATDAIDTATFVIRRLSGPLDVAINVGFTLTGTAQNGVDYKQVSTFVQIPAGSDHVAIPIVPIPDDLAEGEETVILTINLPPCAFPGVPPDCYLVNDQGSGRAVILDTRDDAPGVKILHPLNGAVFTLGNLIQIEAQASDPEGIISDLEILADGQLVGHTNTDHIYVLWSHAGVGEHSIVARATDGAGQVAKSEIHILVQDQNTSAFVFRKLPPAYTPGTAFPVGLRAEPPAGSKAYAVEDHPPTGWAVSDVSEGGAFDPSTGKVKFGPFTDTTARTLSYRVTPPATAAGRQEFFGVGSVDGVNYAIGGDRLTEPSPTEHPADTDKNFAIVVSEVTAYAAAWKSGGDIPISYVTRAGYLWKHGEGYKFDASQQPPLCWAPLDTTPPPSVMAAASVTDCERTGSGETQPGVSANFQIHVSPPAGTSAYAVEEKVPLGWTVSNISNDGTFDSTTGVIRWGVFYDDAARTLSYTLTPPPAVTVVAHLSGSASFDGVVYEISGADQMTSTDSTAQPTLAKCETDGSGKVHLELSGAAGQVSVLQTSSDLLHWQDVTTLYLPDGTVQFDDDASGSAVRYYRLQIR